MRKVSRERFLEILKIILKQRSKFSFTDIQREVEKKFKTSNAEIYKVLFFLEDARLVYVERVYSAKISLQNKKMWEQKIYSTSIDRFREYKSKYLNRVLEKYFNFERPAVCLECTTVFDFDSSIQCPNCGSYNITLVSKETLDKLLVKCATKIPDEIFLTTLYEKGERGIRELIDNCVKNTIKTAMHKDKFVDTNGK